MALVLHDRDTPKLRRQYQTIAETLPVVTDPRIAVIIPTLDEEDAIGRHLAAVVDVANEVVVSDGGSTDRTCERAEALGARVVCGSPGRGAQLDRGARQTDAAILLFLHADTRLPAGALAGVRAAIQDGAVGGGFLAEFNSDRPILRLGARLVNLRTRWTGCPLGDQAQFVSRSAFEALGGFRDWPILEDLDFIRRLKRHGRLVLIEGPVTTSARRFEKRGTLRTVATNWLIWLLYFLRVPPQRLARLYRDVR